MFFNRADTVVVAAIKYGGVTLYICREHFHAQLDPAVAALLFKASVRNIEIAISSYCNRRCPYCPNAVVDRRTTRNFMGDEIFFNILAQLRKIDYDGNIALHRYNEPLANKDYALMRIRDIRQSLPKANIHIYTNGDYLDSATVHELREAGVPYICATVHAAADGTDFATLKGQQEDRLIKLGLPLTFVLDSAAERHAYVDCGGGLWIRYVARDFYHRNDQGTPFMLDRGQSMAVDRQFSRFQPCLLQFSEMQIEWDGTLLPCCNIHPDIVDHQAYTLGKLTADSDLFIAWCSDAYVAWRRTLFSYAPKVNPCATCDYAIIPDEESLRAFVRDSRRAFWEGDPIEF